ESMLQPSGARIMGLDDPSTKMSKSRGETRPRHAIGLVDPPDAIRDAVMHAVTDSGREVRPERPSPGVTNLMRIYELLSGRRSEAVQSEFMGKGYAVLKRAVADLVVSTLEPIRQRYLELSAQPEALDAILAEGAERARLLAAPTLDRVEQLMGLHERSHVPFPLSTLWRADVVQCEAARHEETVQAGRSPNLELGGWARRRDNHQGAHEKR